MLNSAAVINITRIPAPSAPRRERWTRGKHTSQSPETSYIMVLSLIINCDFYFSAILGGNKIIDIMFSTIFLVMTSVQAVSRGVHIK